MSRASSGLAYRSGGADLWGARLFAVASYSRKHFLAGSRYGRKPNPIPNPKTANPYPITLTLITLTLTSTLSRTSQKRSADQHIAVGYCESGKTSLQDPRGHAVRPAVSSVYFTLCSICFLERGPRGA